MVSKKKILTHAMIYCYAHMTIDICATVELCKWSCKFKFIVNWNDRIFGHQVLNLHISTVADLSIVLSAKHMYNVVIVLNR